MFQIDENRLRVWMYKLLLGTLTPTKTRLLKKELDKRFLENSTSNTLELKILAALTGNRPERRKYLAELLDDWEKRNWGDCS